MSGSEKAGAFEHGPTDKEDLRTDPPGGRANKTSAVGRGDGALGHDDDKIGAVLG